jgi:hypothetical protein
MQKVKIEILVLGNMLFEISSKLFPKSSLYEIVKISYKELNYQSEREDWTFSDISLNELIPDSTSGQFIFVITNIPLEDNYYFRVIGANKVCLTYYQIYEILLSQNIPATNLILRLLNALAIFSLMKNNESYSMWDIWQYAHQETSGCIFDLTPYKWDVIYTCDRPHICSACLSKMRDGNITKKQIRKINKEITAIKKPPYYRILSFLQTHPWWSIFISSLWAIVLGLVGTLLYDLISGK